jgi:hypothetical protein
VVPRLGPAGIRAVQVLLENAGEDRWTVSRLAREAGISIGQAHNVFKILDQDRLVTTTGAGPLQRRMITDRAAALDWIAAVDLARRRPVAARAYLYARNDRDLLKRFDALAAEAGLPYAVTGAAAARLLGVKVMSRTPVTQVRVSVLGAEDAAARLGLELLDDGDDARGANLELWSDVGDLGTHRSTRVDQIPVAPAVRVWLDLARTGGRGADAAALFRELTFDVQ